MGIAIGSFIGIGLSLLQYYTGWVQLDESAYFMKTLPIKMIPSQIIMVILGTAVVSYLSFLIPTIWINRISPAKTIRFD
jgi:lipoprotein-releasing system permease protein